MQEEEPLERQNQRLSISDVLNPKIREDAVLFKEDTDSARYAEKVEKEMSVES